MTHPMLPSPPPAPPLQASIAFLKSGEHLTEDEVTVVAPPTLPPKEAGVVKRLFGLFQSVHGGDGGGSAWEGVGGCSFSRLFSRGKGRRQGEDEGEGRKSTLACVAVVVGFGAAVAVGVAAFAASFPPGGGTGGGGGGRGRRVVR